MKEKSNKKRTNDLCWTVLAIAGALIFFIAIQSNSTFQTKENTNGKTQETKSIVQEDNKENEKQDVENNEMKKDEDKNLYNKENYINTVLIKCNANKNISASYSEDKNTIYITAKADFNYNLLNINDRNIINQMTDVCDLMMNTSQSYYYSQSKYGVKIDIVYTLVDCNNIEIIKVTNGDLNYFRMTDE